MCQGRKEAGLVACWPCYRARGLRDGSAEAESMIERAEVKLREASLPTIP